MCLSRLRKEIAVCFQTGQGFQSENKSPPRKIEKQRNGYSAARSALVSTSIHVPIEDLDGVVCSGSLTGKAPAQGTLLDLEKTVLEYLTSDSIDLTQTLPDKFKSRTGSSSAELTDRLNHALDGLSAVQTDDFEALTIAVDELVYFSLEPQRCQTFHSVEFPDDHCNFLKDKSAFLAGRLIDVAMDQELFDTTSAKQAKTMDQVNCRSLFKLTDPDANWFELCRQMKRPEAFLNSPEFYRQSLIGLHELTLYAFEKNWRYSNGPRISAQQLALHERFVAEVNAVAED